MRKYLAYDISRCPGKDDDKCKSCARQVFNKPEHCGNWQPWIGPQLKDGQCENFIDMEEKSPH